MVVSFYTDNPPYPDQIVRMARSCAHAGMQYHIERLEHRDSWANTCSMKADYCRRLHGEYGRILWLDADAEVIERPDTYDDPPFGFAIHRHPRSGFQSGTVYFGDGAGPLLAAWVSMCNRTPHRWDQKSLSRAYEHMQDPPETHWLHQGHCKIYDQGWHTGECPEYFRHHQASRKARKTHYA